MEEAISIPMLDKGRFNNFFNIMIHDQTIFDIDKPHATHQTTSTE